MDDGTAETQMKLECPVSSGDTETCHKSGEEMLASGGGGWLTNFDYVNQIAEEGKMLFKLAVKNELVVKMDINIYSEQIQASVYELRDDGEKEDVQVYSETFTYWLPFQIHNRKWKDDTYEFSKYEVVENLAYYETYMSNYTVAFMDTLKNK